MNTPYEETGFSAVPGGTGYENYSKQLILLQYFLKLTCFQGYVGPLYRDAGAKAAGFRVFGGVKVHGAARAQSPRARILSSPCWKALGTQLQKPQRFNH